MRHLDFVSCPADPDVWMWPAKKADGSTCYDYILLYVDDALVISERVESILQRELGRYFELKEESIRPPSLYLGGNVWKVVLEDGTHACALSSSQYVQTVVKNVEEYVNAQDRKDLKLPTRAETPMRTSYRPEMDITPELDAKNSAYYQSLIGILQWVVELGCVDICLAVSMMSVHLALPRKGHLDQVLQIFGYLKKYHNTELVHDPSEPEIELSQFERRDSMASEFGHVVGKEETPKDMPEPRGMGFVIQAKVDADHASDTTTRRSRTGFLVYINSAPIFWWSKKQTSIESSSFGSEFIVMKQCCKYLCGL